MIHLLGYYFDEFFYSTCTLVHSHPVTVSESLNYRLMKLICKPITMTTCQQRHHQVSNGVRDETTSSQSVRLSVCLAATSTTIVMVFFCTLPIQCHYLGGYHVSPFLRTLPDLVVKNKRTRVSSCANWRDGWIVGVC